MDPDWPGWTRTDPDRPGWTRTDPDGPGRTRTDQDGPRWTQTDPDIPRQTQGSHGFQMVLPDFRTNSCGILIGSLESEDIRTFLLLKGHSLSIGISFQNTEKILYYSKYKMIDLTIQCCKISLPSWSLISLPIWTLSRSVLGYWALYIIPILWFPLCLVL